MKLFIIFIILAIISGCGGMDTVPPEARTETGEAPEKDPAVRRQHEQGTADHQTESGTGTEEQTTVLRIITFTSGLSVQGIIEPGTSGIASIRTEVGRCSIPEKNIASVEPVPLPAGHIGKPGKPTETNDGLEAADVWKVQTWGNRARVKREAETGGNIRLRIITEGGGRDKAAVQLERKTDLEHKSSLVMDVFNPGPGTVDIAAAFVTGPGWTYYESRTVTVPEGWSRNAAVDLTSSEYKSQKTGWKFQTEITNRKQTSRIFILIYSGNANTELIFDNIQFR